MLNNTSRPLKKRLWVAGVGSDGSSVAFRVGRPMRVTGCCANSGQRRRFWASAVHPSATSAGCGCRVPLLPDARPDDGVLDAVVLIASGLASWLTMTADVPAAPPDHRRTHRIQFSEVPVAPRHRTAGGLDGEDRQDDQAADSGLPQPGAPLLLIPSRMGLTACPQRKSTQPGRPEVEHVFDHRTGHWWQATPPPPRTRDQGAHGPAGRIEVLMVVLLGVEVVHLDGAPCRPDRGQRPHGRGTDPAREVDNR